MNSNKVELSLEDGIWIAHEFLDGIAHFVRPIATIAGSIRRLKGIVHDVDIVINDPETYDWASLIQRCEGSSEIKVQKWGPKLAAIIYRGIPIDLYFSTPETFATLLLIRTGSKEDNIRLCSIAKAKGRKLHASGEGLFNEKGDLDPWAGLEQIRDMAAEVPPGHPLYFISFIEAARAPYRQAHGEGRPGQKPTHLPERPGRGA